MENDDDDDDDDGGGELSELASIVRAWQGSTVPSDSRAVKTILKRRYRIQYNKDSGMFIE
jgi:hypothetical protein